MCCYTQSDTPCFKSMGSKLRAGANEPLGILRPIGLADSRLGITSQIRADKMSGKCLLHTCAIQVLVRISQRNESASHRHETSNGGYYAEGR